MIVHTPQSLADVAEARREGGVVIAGGTALMPRINTQAHDVAALVSLRRAGLDGVAVAGGRATIGAATTLTALRRDERLAFLHGALDTIASPTIRNMATVGGNLFVAQPYGDLAVCLVALDATATLNGDRELPVAAAPDSRRARHRGLVRRPRGRRVVLHEGDAAAAELGLDRHRRGRRRAVRRRRAERPDRARRRRPEARARHGRRGGARRAAARPRARRGGRRGRARRRRARSATPTPAPGTASASCPSTSAAPCSASRRRPPHAIHRHRARGQRDAAGAPGRPGQHAADRAAREGRRHVAQARLRAGHAAAPAPAWSTARPS